MHIKLAYEKLEVSRDISDDELKKKYKALVRKYHPDINKDEPDKFKEINEAFQTIQEYRKNPFQRTGETDDTDFPFEMNVQDIFSNFHGFSGFGRQQQKQRQVPNISCNVEVSFEESVLGVEKEIEIDREIKCEACNGQGVSVKKNNCLHCDGFGHSTIKQGHMTIQTNCSYCKGKTDKEDCKVCEKKTFIPTKTLMKVKIPAGIHNGNTLQLGGAGHFASSSIFGDAYSSVLLQVNVKNETALRLEENDVIYDLKISLLEALEGCQKEVPSIKGNKKIDISPGSRNKEEIIIQHLGVMGQGNQRIILDINYPENKEKLISILKEVN